jgi:zinc transport system permease protein
MWLTPLAGAILAAVVSAAVIGFVTKVVREREDTIIAAIWAVGMAVGLLFIAITPTYVDPMSYLFGNILIVSRSDLYLIAILDAVVIATSVLFYNQLQASAFDEEYARVKGLSIDFYFMLLLLLVAVTVVLMVSIVGIVMVIALLTLPAAVSSLFSRRLWQMMILAGVFTVVMTGLGMAISYPLDLPSGSVIIVLSGVFYIAAMVVRGIVRHARRTGAAR